MMNLPTPNDPGITGKIFIDALAHQAWEKLASCFDEAVQFRALIPSGLKNAEDRASAAGYLQKWFGDADQLILIDSNVQPIQDRWHISYRFRAHEDQWYVVEQHIYCVMQDGLIKKANLLCSGFRPEATPAN
jgi:hypothetical protein